MIIETKRLLLRPVAESDDGDIFAYAKEENVGPNAGWKPHQNIQETREIMRQLFLGQEDVFAMVYRQQGQVIGTIGLVADPKRDNERSRMLGYAMSERFWGQGLMPEAVRAVIRYGFEQLNLELIAAYCYPHNHRSQAVLRKCGFLYEGTILQASRLYDGNVYDDKCYSMLLSDYLARAADAML